MPPASGEIPIGYQKENKSITRPADRIGLITNTTFKFIEPAIGNLRSLVDPIQTKPHEQEATVELIRSNSKKLGEYMGRLKAIQEGASAKPPKQAPIFIRAEKSVDKITGAVKITDTSYFYLEEEVNPDDPPSGVEMREIKNPTDNTNLTLTTLKDAFEQRASEIAGDAEILAERWNIEPEKFNDIKQASITIAQGLKRIQKAYLKSRAGEELPLLVDPTGENPSVIDLSDPALDEVKTKIPTTDYEVSLLRAGNEDAVLRAVYHKLISSSADPALLEIIRVAIIRTSSGIPLALKPGTNEIDLNPPE